MKRNLLDISGNSTVVLDEKPMSDDGKLSIGDEFGNKTITGVVLDADLDYQDYNKLFTTLKYDQKAVYVKIKMTNTSDKSNYVSVADFKCYVDNISTNPEMITGGDEDYNANIETWDVRQFSVLYTLSQRMPKTSNWNTIRSGKQRKE